MKNFSSTMLALLLTLGIVACSDSEDHGHAHDGDAAQDHSEGEHRHDGDEAHSHDEPETEAFYGEEAGESTTSGTESDHHHDDATHSDMHDSDMHSEEDHHDHGDGSDEHQH